MFADGSDGFHEKSILELLTVAAFCITDDGTLYTSLRLLCIGDVADILVQFGIALYVVQMRSWGSEGYLIIEFYVGPMWNRLELTSTSN